MLQALGYGPLSLQEPQVGATGASSLEDLPDVILVQILSQLPFKARSASLETKPCTELSVHLQLSESDDLSTEIVTRNMSMQADHYTSSL